jgi:hypothetical protein
LPFGFEATDAIVYGGANEALAGVRKAPPFERSPVRSR